MKIDRGRAVADAVLFEGYALYPYRASSTKNQLRWQFGVLLARAASEKGRSDPWWLESQCLATGGRVEAKLRFLRVRRRRVESPSGEPIASLEVDGKLLVPWDEGEPFEHDFSSSGVLGLAGDRTEEWIHRDGVKVAKIVRTRAPMSLRLTMEETPIDGGMKLRVRVENVSACADPSAPRETQLEAATLGTHLLFSVENGEFVSLIDPPVRFAQAAAGCRGTGVYPVLIDRDLVLTSPIILYDYPAVAPESPGDLFDACEIDEILTLRTLLLTDQEKREARATDPRVAALIDRVESLSGEVLSGLHGAFRSPSVGQRVRLKPGARRTDAQDMFLEGLVATVREVKRDVDGRECLAVTIDDDPAAELNAWKGRYHYFYADEVEPLT